MCSENNNAPCGIFGEMAPLTLRRESRHKETGRSHTHAPPGCFSLYWLLLSVADMALFSPCPGNLLFYAGGNGCAHGAAFHRGFQHAALGFGHRMRHGDVEYQGDGNKAIFYYIADGRVDFRQLIKVLAEAFRVRIEMKQIGARQEAGRIGGFGPCGRELCCASWMKSFVSVNTGAARFQDLSLNPQKLAGQCAKLKCCMNYEVDQYVEAGRKLPSREMVLQTQDAEFYLFKADILSGMVTYSSDRRLAANLTTITAERAMAIIAMNKEGEKPASLQAEGVVQENGVVDLATQDDMNRFDKKKKKKKNKSKGENRQAAPSADSAQNEKETPSAEEHPNTAQPRRQKGQRNGNRKDGDRKPRRDRKDNTSQNDKPQETGQA